MNSRIAALALISLSCVACSGSPDDATSAPNPFQAHALPSAQRRWLEGRVLERLSAGHYVYLRVATSAGERSWLVSLAATTPRGERVRALVLGRAERFHSRRLGRDFDPLLFAAVRSAANEPASSTLNRLEARK